MLRKPLLIGVSAVVLVAAACIGGLALYGWQMLNSPMNIVGDSLRISVSPGRTLSRVGADLAADGVVANDQLLRWYGRFSGDATQIKAGEYDVLAGTTPKQLVDLLVAGNVVQYSFTIIEGWRFQDLMSAIRAHEQFVSTGLDDATVMAALGEPDLHPEGQFLPDTYHFPRDTKDIDVLKRAHAALLDTLAEAWRNRSTDVSVATDYEALVLASIIEKETALTSERRQISGVFNRRLKQGIRLQADPTVIYGLGPDYDGNIRSADLQADTPYNTYTRRGLPPTPIALAGADAIRAAVNPALGDALYFVATGEADGSHYFSASLEEHNAAVSRYLKTLRSKN